MSSYPDFGKKLSKIKGLDQDSQKALLDLHVRAHYGARVAYTEDSQRGRLIDLDVLDDAKESVQSGLITDPDVVALVGLVDDLVYDHQLIAR